MRVPRWLLPVICVIAALAIALASTLIGFRFAAPEVRTSPAKTITVPVLGFGDGKALSEVVGHRTVTEPGSVDSPVSARDQRVIHEALHAQDPVGVVAAGGETGTGGTPVPGGDPCSPAVGTPPPTCPGGVHGAIRDGLRPMFVDAAAYPADHNADPLGVRCPAPTTTVAGDVPVGLVAPAPSHYTIDYWPIGDTAARQEVTVSTADADRAAYRAANDNPAIASSDLPIQRSCITLHVDPSMQYGATVSATDDDGRPAAPRSFVFDGAGSQVHPEVEVSTIGDNVAVVSAVHTADEHVDFRLVRGTDTSSGACDGGTIVTGSGTTTPTDTHLDAAYVSAHHWPADDAIRSTITEFIPVGSQFLVCARWISGARPAASDWSATSTYQSRQWMESPDRLLPSIVLTQWQFGTHSDTAQVSVSSEAGNQCGTPLMLHVAVDAHGFGTVAPPGEPTLCDPDHYFGASRDGSRFYDDPANAAFVITVDLTTNSTPVHDVFALNAPALPCSDPCATLYGDRSPRRIYHETSGELFLFSVTYHEAGSSRVASWQAGGVLGNSAASSSPSRPSFDTSAAVTAGAIDPTALSAAIGVPIGSDRPVDYTVRVRDAINPALAGCTRGSATGVVSGHLDHAGVVTVPGLCIATSYLVQVQLVDSSGAHSLWDAIGSDPEGIWPRSKSSIVTAGLPSTLRYDMTINGFPNAVFSDSLAILGRSAFQQFGGDLVHSCSASGTIHFAGTAPGAAMPQNSMVLVEYRLRTQYSACGPVPNDTHPILFEQVYVTLDQLLSADGVVVHGTGDADFTLHLWLDRT